MQEMNVMLEPLRVFLIQLGELMPKIIFVIIVLLAGWLIAKTIKLAVVKGLNRINFHVLTQRGGLDGFLQQGGTKTDTTHILGLLSYWLVILAALILASNSVGLGYVTDILARSAILLVRIIFAAVILVFGLYFAQFIGTSVTAYGKNLRLPDTDFLGRLARLAVVTFVVLIALDQLSIGGNLIRDSFLILLAGLVLALALAFGIGGREWAGALLSRWWPNNRVHIEYKRFDRRLHHEADENLSSGGQHE